MSSSAGPTNPASAAADAPPSEGAPRRSGLRVVWHVVALAALFGGAFLASWLMRGRNAHDGDHADAHDEPPKPALKKADHGSLAELLARGDEALTHHRYAEALSCYGEFLENDAAALPRIDYRVGLCQESLGQFDKAIAAFSRALSASAARPLRHASQLGIARCLLRQNQGGAARRALYPLLLDEERQQGLPLEWLGDARYLIALALARDTHAVADPLALDRLATFADGTIPTPFYLEEIGRPVEVIKNAGPPATPLVIKKSTPKEPACVELVAQFDQPARALLDKIASEAGLRTEWSEQAQRQAQDRSLNVNVRHWTVQELLEVVADGIDIACVWEKDTVHFTTDKEAGELKATARKRELAGRALQAALRHDASHELSAAACLELGNLAASAGKFVAAGNWYDRLVRESATSSFSVLGYYNRGHLQLRQQELVHARKDFFRAIDQGPGHDFAMRAYVRLGRMCLEQEDAREAIALLKRAQVMGPASPHLPLATLTLAAAYLSQGTPELARICMEKQRTVLQQDPFKPTAAFLDAFARYQLAKTSGFSRREAADLLSTLWHYHDATLLGPMGHCLIAHAYDELGFVDQAERVLRQAATQSQGSLALFVDLKLGDALLKQDKRDQAQPLFEKIAGTTSPHRFQARYQLARVELLEKRWKECAERCEALWKEHAFEEPLVLLQLWGAALEGAGDHTRAAQCFAGKAPD